MFFTSPLFLKKLIYRIAICAQCGHIQVYPMFDENQYMSLNQRKFDQLYLKDGNLSDNSRKLLLLKERFDSYIKGNEKVLDIGAGEGWTLDYFTQKGCSYFAIEAVEKLALSLRERGGHTIGKSIFDNYDKYEGSFDIIIFRHILEHLLNPIEALYRIKFLLRKGGLIYLALPNAANPGIKKGFCTGYLSPVHISYFRLENVLRIAQSVGLTAIAEQAGGEIYCLLTQGDKNVYNWENYYQEQKTIFLHKRKAALFIDVRNLFLMPFILLKRFLYRYAQRGWI